jgi:hypothetical protein
MLRALLLTGVIATLSFPAAQAAPHPFADWQGSYEVTDCQYSRNGEAPTMSSCGDYAIDVVPGSSEADPQYALVIKAGFFVISHGLDNQIYRTEELLTTCSSAGDAASALHTCDTLWKKLDGHATLGTSEHLSRSSDGTALLTLARSTYLPDGSIEQRYWRYSLRRK